MAMQYERAVYPPIQSREKRKDFMLKVKANSAESNFSGLQGKGHEATKIRLFSFAVTI